jgi:hypothetical protein
MSILRVIFLFAASAGCLGATPSHGAELTDKEMCSDKHATDIPVWEIQLACYRVTYNACVISYQASGRADELCTLLMQNPPSPKGSCSFQDYLNKTRGCFYPGKGS